MPTVTLASQQAMDAISMLGETASASADNQNATSRICSVVAMLIANAGSYGGASQKNLLDHAKRCGFSPEFYPGQRICIRRA